MSANLQPTSFADWEHLKHRIISLSQHTQTAEDDTERTLLLQTLRGEALSCIRLADLDRAPEVLDLAATLIAAPHAFNAHENIEIACDIIQCLVCLGETGEVAAKLATFAQDQLFQVVGGTQHRRLSNGLAILYLQRGDYANACTHAAQACSLGLESADPLHFQAALANTVAIAEEMGCLTDAKTLALHVTTLPNTTWRSATVQAQNAANGMRLCFETDDKQSSHRYFEISYEAERECSDFLDEVTRVYLNVGRVLHFLLCGLADEARTLLKTLEESYGSSPSVRVRSLVWTTAAFFIALSRDESSLNRVITELSGLLESAKKLPFCYNIVCEGLIRVLHVKGKIADLRAAYEYASELRHYNVKLRAPMFATLSAVGHNFLPSKYAMSNPTLRTMGVFSGMRLGDRPLELQDYNDRLSGLGVWGAPLNGSLMQFRAFSREATIAENWAVASEFIGGKSGYHGKCVGRLAALIAQELGFKDEDALLTGWQCSLHDIGKMFVSRAIVGSSIDQGTSAFAVSEHALAGAALLNSSASADLQGAALIAKHHHEWWNGCGPPDGLRGEEIPLGARICAVSDVYVNLLVLPSDESAWSNDAALRQLDAMSGVQLDPRVVAALDRVVKREESIDDGMGGWISGALQSSVLN